MKNQWRTLFCYPSTWHLGAGQQVENPYITAWGWEVHEESMNNNLKGQVQLSASVFPYFLNIYFFPGEACLIQQENQITRQWQQCRAKPTVISFSLTILWLFIRNIHSLIIALFSMGSFSTRICMPLAPSHQDFSRPTQADLHRIFSERGLYVTRQVVLKTHPDSL